MSAAERLSVGPAARIVLRPIGNPLPLGFLALAGAAMLVPAGVAALRGDLTDQLERVEREAGVREQL